MLYVPPKLANDEPTISYPPSVTDASADALTTEFHVSSVTSIHVVPLSRETCIPANHSTDWLAT